MIVLSHRVLLLMSLGPGKMAPGLLPGFGARQVPRHVQRNDRNRPEEEGEPVDGEVRQQFGF